jgi:nickel/cobalt exporter
VINESFALISIGFSLGLVHALDADHVMAVSALSNSRPGFLKTISFCAHWALGHGGVLMASGLLLFGLGISIPESLSHIAEIFVGVFLIAIGLACFWRFRRERISLVEHQHGEVVHRHWQIEGDTAHSGKTSNHRYRGHTPVLVGVMHGLAGSAPALALIPMVAHGELLMAMLYLVLFSVGVMLAMLAFGLGFGATQGFLQKRYLWLFNYFRNFVALGSVLFGGYWLSQAL